MDDPTQDGEPQPTHLALILREGVCQRHDEFITDKFEITLSILPDPHLVQRKSPFAILAGAIFIEHNEVLTQFRSGLGSIQDDDRIAKRESTHCWPLLF